MNKAAGSRFSLLGGKVPIIVLRNGDWYLAAKGGSPSAPHGHMDGGSFVLDAGGVRWASELGREEYPRIEAMGTIDLWNQGQDSSRWSLFRLGLEGHGTLQIDNERQNVKGCATIVKGGAASAAQRSRDFSSAEGMCAAKAAPPLTAPNGDATLDLTTLYHSATKVLRQFALDENGLRISDRLEGLRPGAVVTWNMNTAAKVAEVDGGRLILEANGRRMTLTANGVWETESLDAPRTPADSPNPGFTRIRFRRTAPADGHLDLSVIFAETGR